MTSIFLRKFRNYGIPIIVLVLLFFLYARVTEFAPEPETVIASWNKPDTIETNTTLSAITWNVGYAGLGSNMDFFYDDGRRVRDSHEQTIENLEAIKSFIDDHRNFDFMFFQEVDMDSHRSYRINEFNQISDVLKRPSSYGINFHASFVPIPIFNPIMGVMSCISTYSEATPSKSIRYSYPGSFALPSRMFNLKRCMLVSRFNVSNGKELVLINTHNSAFDKGELKSQEMEFMRAFATNEYQKGNYVVIGGDWNQSPPDFSLMTFGQNYNSPAFKLTNIDRSFMPNGWQWIFDSTKPTNRYLNEPFVQGSTYVGILDFFLFSPNIKFLECSTFDLQFKNSDHNPVAIKFQLVEDTLQQPNENGK